MAGELIGAQQATASNVPLGYVVDQSSLTANPHGEGTYKMVGPQGQTVQVPFSKVRGAQDMRYQVVPDDLKRYTKDAAAATPGWTGELADWGKKTFPNITAADAQELVTTPNDVSPSGEPSHPHQPWLDSSDDWTSDSGPYAYDIKPIMAPIVEFGENVVNNLARTAASIPAEVAHGIHHLLSPSQWEILDPDSWTPAGYQRKQQKEVAAALASGQGRVLAPGERPPEPTAEMWNDYASDQATKLIEMWGGSKLLGPVFGAASEGLGFKQAAGDGLRDAARDVMGGSETPALPNGTAFSVPFTQIMDSLDGSELDQRAQAAQRDLVHEIFQRFPKLQFQMADGKIEETPAEEFFTLDPKTRDELKDRVINPITRKTLGQEQGLEVSQQAADGGGLANPQNATAETAPVTAATPEVQTALQTGAATEDAGTLAANTQPTNARAANPPTTNTPATHAPAISTQAAGNANASSNYANASGTAKANPSAAFTINKGKQAKHMPPGSGYLKGREGYIAGNSILTDDPAGLVSYAGTGQQVGIVPRGQPGFKERIDIGRVIGIHIDKPTGIQMPSTNLIIVYDGKNQIHMYPGQP